MDDNKYTYLENLRKDYDLGSLEETELFENPIRQFKKWFQEVQDLDVNEPNAMILATASPDGKPTARVVLLKGIDNEGFRFYTNYNSLKGKTIKENPDVSIVFFWREIQRQVCIQGTAYKLSEVESTRYFQSRPKESQIGAWASPQSEVILSRDILTKNLETITNKFSDQEVLPRPAHWGGYIVKPYQIEFWQGRKSRLHDRFRYTLTELNPSKWTLERLAP
ncbi:MAG: pyridoxamine 5'-phosphate oxidase [Saprospiraceae bacterium]|nr:pyridoxamine 5'-phosphate oxidase [Saprospiraceae bacterium]